MKPEEAGFRAEPCFADAAMNCHSFVYRASLVLQAVLASVACVLTIVVLLRPIGAVLTRMGLSAVWTVLTFSLPVPIGIFAAYRNHRRLAHRVLNSA
jgi:hypothetical protein